MKSLGDAVKSFAEGMESLGEPSTSFPTGMGSLREALYSIQNPRTPTPRLGGRRETNCW